jgi:4-amino-4-deoxy-L-arabinose transferase-like glycosyltransferase
LAAWRDPDFLQFFFVHEHLARYLTAAADRAEPWWFFGYVLLVGTIPWTVSMIRVLVTGWHGRDAQKFDAPLFLWLWVVFILLFFSISNSKLMPYILPALPALALLMARLPVQRAERDLKWTAMLTVVAGLAIGWAAFDWPHVLSHSARAQYFLPLAPALKETAAILTLTGALAALQRSDTTRTTVFLGVGWCLAWLLVVRAAAWVAPIYSGVGLAAALPAAARNEPIYSIGDYDQSLTFYLRRPVTLVRFRGELDYGLQKSGIPVLSSLEEFVARWSAQANAYAVMRKGTFDELTSRGVPMRIVAENAVKVLVARQ